MLDAFASFCPMFMVAHTISIVYYCVSVDDHKLLLKKKCVTRAAHSYVIQAVGKSFKDKDQGRIVKSFMSSRKMGCSVYLNVKSLAN